MIPKGRPCAQTVFTIINEARPQCQVNEPLDAVTWELGEFSASVRTPKPVCPGQPFYAKSAGCGFSGYFVRIKCRQLRQRDRRNLGSRDSLNVSVRCGLMLWLRQILLTLDLPIPCAAAMVRQLQCVFPLGLVCKVASITALIRVAS
jgi:hypothetical protein